MKKKIFLITTVPEVFITIFSGQAKFLSKFYDITLISSKIDHMSSLSEIAEKEGVKYFCVDMHRGISPLKDVIAIYKLSRYLRAEKPDIVHSFTPKAGLVSAIASFITRINSRVHTFTGLIFPTAKGVKKQVLKFFDRLVVSLNTHIVCEGRGVWGQLESSGISSNKFRIIGNGNVAGVDCEYFSSSNALEDKSFVKPHGKVYIYVGRLNKDKGINELVKAFVHLEKSNLLVMVGAEDSTLPVEKNIMDTIKNEENIIYLGFQKDVRAYMQFSDYLVLPSYREGFPNVLLQAGAMGLPCIVTDVPGSNEVISKYYNGWIVEPNSVDSLLEAFRQSLSLSDMEYQKYSHNARCNVLSKYERSYYYSKLKSFYDEI
ncbi:glycosyltransferase [Pseudoalteromonas viridis]|uniref:Glycosyltransferase n=1 Tax=Pseudoalteromonas viridis TaxID=339617 RepID=A0ABX7V5C1_9GAMM|nr:glycosyltransferase [Pseudoalteromonas viridis]QTL36069.1 glycosyltransferase [Pseudoalteromonas viridis]